MLKGKATVLSNLKVIVVQLQCMAKLMVNDNYTVSLLLAEKRTRMDTKRKLKSNMQPIKRNHFEINNRFQKEYLNLRHKFSLDLELKHYLSESTFKFSNSLNLTVLMVSSVLIV